MPNDVGTLSTALQTALRDPLEKTWETEELDDLVTWSCARIFPRVARRVRETVTLVADQSEYELSDVAEVNRVDVLDADDALLLHLPGGTWEFWGDGEAPGGTLYVNSVYADADHSLRIHGWAPYDLIENPPPDKYVPLILAQARAEACRREITRRANFTQWQTINQVQNVSVNELVLMQNEADAEARQLKQEVKTWRRPVPARVG